MSEVLQSTETKLCPCPGAHRAVPPSLCSSCEALFLQKEHDWFWPPGVWHTHAPTDRDRGKPLAVWYVGAPAGEVVGTALTISLNHPARNTIKLHLAVIILHTS